MEICAAIFSYAVDCVLSEIKQIKKENSCYFNSYAKKLCDSYGYGFCNGIAEAFRKQQEENEQGWGLVLVMPQEVVEASQHLGKEAFKARAQEDISGGSYARGYYKGKEFNPEKRLGTEATV